MRMHFLYFAPRMFTIIGKYNTWYISSSINVEPNCHLIRLTFTISDQKFLKRQTHTFSFKVLNSNFQIFSFLLFSNNTYTVSGYNKILYKILKTLGYGVLYNWDHPIGVNTRRVRFTSTMSYRVRRHLAMVTFP
jgi:hypothetical protein